MDADSLVNANPTIIDPADLPSRKPAGQESAAARRPALFSILSDSSSTPDTSSNSTSTTSSSPSYLSSSSSSSSSSPTPEQTEEIDTQEIFDLISPISDPEHPLSLGSLGVVKLSDIAIVPSSPSTSSSTSTSTSTNKRIITTVRVLVTPTTSACSLTTVIGLGIKVRLLRALPPRFRVDVRIKEGTSRTADEVNKQLGDKERVAAAMENRSLVGVVGQMLATCP